MDSYSNSTNLCKNENENIHKHNRKCLCKQNSFENDNKKGNNKKIDFENNEQLKNNFPNKTRNIRILSFNSRGFDEIKGIKNVTS